MSARPREALVLYRRLLRLHQRLPVDYADVGVRFLREEFKRHTNAKEEFAKQFMKEWTIFAETLESQLGGGNRDMTKFGRPLSSQEVDLLSSEQTGQLYELQHEVRKPPLKPTDNSTKTRNP